jgi:hypothetical protein
MRIHWNGYYSHQLIGMAITLTTNLKRMQRLHEDCKDIVIKKIVHVAKC